MIQAIVVGGPTGSGKTALAIAIAERLNTEIISADCMQCYKGMEIGTAAPTPEERARVPHHFVGFLAPNEEFCAGEFERLARSVVETCNQQGKPAVVAGGSGLYIRALIDGLFPGPGKDDAIRERLHAEAETDGGVARLFIQLESVDPGYAQVISPNDLRRIVRALEVYELTGRPFSVLHAEHRQQVQSMPSVQVAFAQPREVLYARINRRAELMLEQGLEEEVKTLIQNGYKPDLYRLRSLGYMEMMDYLDQKISLEEALELIQRNTRRYAKRQLTWFRHDPRVQWLSWDETRTVDDYAREVVQSVENT